MENLSEWLDPERHQFLNQGPRTGSLEYTPEWVRASYRNVRSIRLGQYNVAGVSGDLTVGNAIDAYGVYETGKSAYKGAMKLADPYGDRSIPQTEKQTEEDMSYPVTPEKQISPSDPFHDEGFTPLSGQKRKRSPHGS